MSLTGGHLDAFLAAGLTAEQIVALVKADIQEREKEAETRRAKDRERQRRHRESRDVTVTDCDSADPSPLEVSPQTPLPKTPNQTAPLNPPKMRFKSEWNDMATKHGLPKIAAIAGKRERALNARIKEHGLDAISRAIAAVPNSPHWMGANGWLGNFDSLMRPDNFQRMLEGTYAPKQTPAPKPLTDEQIRNIERRYVADGHQEHAAEMRKLYPQAFGEVARNIVRSAA